MNDLIIDFVRDVRFLKGDLKTLITNIDNGQGIFVSNECLEILHTAINEKITYQQLFDSIDDKSSEKYMMKLVNKLKELDMLKDQVKTNINEKDISIKIDITNECNLRCTHCCVSAGEGKSGEELATNELEVILDKILELNPRSLCISGGEPLNRKDFKYLILKIKRKYNGQLALMTNGVLIDDDMAKFISENFYHVDISIDGINEETCSLIRGKGVFDKVIRSIKLLKKYNFNNITASMLVTKHTQKYSMDFKKMCEDKLGIEAILRGFDNSGRGKKYADQIEIDEWNINFKERKKYLIENKCKVRLPIFSCQGAKREFQIDQKGELFPCALLMDDEFKMGNILEINNFRDYILQEKFKLTEGYKKFQSYMPYNVEKCKDCNKNLLCFTCVNEVRKHKHNIKIVNCNMNKEYFDLYWNCNEN